MYATPFGLFPMSLVGTFTVENETGRPLRHSMYIGGKTDAKDYDKLVHRWKISHVLNVTPPKQTNIEAGVPNYFSKTAPQIVYKRIPIYDAPASLPELQTHEGTIVRFLAKGLCHGNVLVHCSRGVSRSTSSVILYLMAKREMRYEEALAMIRRRRPQACPIPAFEAWLKERDEYHHSKRRQQEQQNAETDDNAPNHSDKKRKRLSGPSPPPPSSTSRNKKGPSIGPAAPPRSIGPESPTSSSKRASIGPQLPPPASDAVDNKSNHGIGPELPPPP